LAAKEVFSSTPDRDIGDAEKLMREKQIRRLTVIDGQGHLAGIISLNDIAREGERETEMKKTREVSDAEIARVMASVCAPRHRMPGVAA
jgi:CBS-domain-containing membrane protein